MFYDSDGSQRAAPLPKVLSAARRDETRRGRREASDAYALDRLAGAAGGVSWQFEAIERAAATGPLRKVARRAQRGLHPTLVWETARAARDTGRRPEEVWAEALGNWLALQQADTTRAVTPRTLETRRQLAWRDIEETLSALRVG